MRRDRVIGVDLGGTKILAGIVNVNSATVNDEIHAPMRGVRDSGWGRTGPESLKEFQDLIWINAHSGQRWIPPASPTKNSASDSAASPAPVEKTTLSASL